MKQSLIKAAVFGASFAFTLGVLTLLVMWYLSRPKPPVPWDKAAITAEFDRVGTEEDDRYPSFAYTLQNNTDRDYQLNGASVVANARLLAQNSLSTLDDDHILLKSYVFLPPKQRTRLLLYIKYEFPDSLKRSIRSAKSTEAGLTMIRKYLADDMHNLNGFVLLDKDYRYEITLPRGW
jgi:hypothetical protein